MNFFKRLQLLWGIVTHKEAPWSVKLILLAGFLYIIFPADILPDYLVLAGWLDDALLATVIYLLAMKFTPEDIIRRLWDKDDHDET